MIAQRVAQAGGEKRRQLIQLARVGEARQMSGERIRAGDIRRARAGDIRRARLIAR